METKVLRNKNGVHLVELRGTLDLYSSEQLKSLIMKMLENKAERFIIGLSGVDNINSAGIGALIYISSTLKKLSCPLILIVPNGPVMQALEITRLTAYFTIAPTLKKALALTANP